MMAAASVCSALLFQPPGAVAQQGGYCLEWRRTANGDLVCVAWSSGPADPGHRYEPPTGGDEADPYGRGSESQDSDDWGSAEGDNESRPIDDRWSGAPGAELGRDSAGLGPGGGSGEPPPACTETVMERRTAVRVDDRGWTTRFLSRRCITSGFAMTAPPPSWCARPTSQWL